MNNNLNSAYSFGLFFNQLFNEELAQADKYDQEIVALLRDHLGQENIHSQAGKRLASDLIELAKVRSKENS